MIDRARKIIETLEGSARKEMTLLVNALDACMQAYNESPVASRKKDWDVAAEALATAVAMHESQKRHKNTDPGGNLVQQTFKNRKLAHAWLVAEGVPVGQTKFYSDADRLGLVKPNKTIDLCDLITYIRSEFKRPASGQPVNQIEAQDRQKEKEELELRKLRADVALIERKNRKDDDLWMETIEHEIQMAAFAGLVEDTLRQLTTIKLSKLIYLCGGDPSKDAEFNQGLEDLYATALTDAVKEKNRELTFTEDEEHDRH